MLAKELVRGVRGSIGSLQYSGMAMLRHKAWQYCMLAGQNANANTGGIVAGRNSAGRGLEEEWKDWKCNPARSTLRRGRRIIPPRAKELDDECRAIRRDMYAKGLRARSALAPVL